MEGAYQLVRRAVNQQFHGSGKEAHNAGTGLTAALKRFPVLKEFAVNEVLTRRQLLANEFAPPLPSSEGLPLRERGPDVLVEGFCRSLESILRSLDPSHDKQLLLRLILSVEEEEWGGLLQTGELSCQSLMVVLGAELDRLERDKREKKLSLGLLARHKWLGLGLDLVSQALLGGKGDSRQIEGEDVYFSAATKSFFLSICRLAPKLQEGGVVGLEDRERVQALRSTLSTLLELWQVHQAKMRDMSVPCACQWALESGVASTDNTLAPSRRKKDEERGKAEVGRGQNLLLLIQESGAGWVLLGGNEELDRRLRTRENDGPLRRFGDLLLSCSGRKTEANTEGRTSRSSSPSASPNRDETENFVDDGKSHTCCHLGTRRPFAGSAVQVLSRALSVVNRTLLSSRSPSSPSLEGREAYVLGLLRRVSELLRTEHSSQEKEEGEDDLSEVLVETLGLLTTARGHEEREDILSLQAKLGAILLQLGSATGPQAKVLPCCRFLLSVLSIQIETTIVRLYDQAERQSKAETCLEQLKALMAPYLVANSSIIQSRRELCKGMLCHLLCRMGTRGRKEAGYPCTSALAAVTCQLVSFFLTIQRSSRGSLGEDHSVSFADELCLLFTLIFRGNETPMTTKYQDSRQRPSVFYLVKLWLILCSCSPTTLPVLSQTAPAVIRQWLKSAKWETPFLSSLSSVRTGPMSPFIPSHLSQDVPALLLLLSKTLRMSSFCPPEVEKKLIREFEAAGLEVDGRLDSRLGLHSSGTRAAGHRGQGGRSADEIYMGEPEFEESDGNGRQLVLKICSMTREELEELYGCSHDGILSTESSQTRPPKTMPVAEAVVALLREYFFSLPTMYSAGDRRRVIKTVNRLYSEQRSSWKPLGSLLYPPPHSLLQLLGLGSDTSLPEDKLAFSSGTALAHHPTFIGSLGQVGEKRPSLLRLETALKLYLLQPDEGKVPDLRHLTLVLLLGFPSLHSGVVEDFLLLLEKYNDLLDAEMIAEVLQQMTVLAPSLSSSLNPTFTEKALSLLKLLGMAARGHSWSLIFTSSFLSKIPAQTESRSLLIAYVDFLLLNEENVELDHLLIIPRLASLLCAEALFPALTARSREQAKNAYEVLMARVRSHTLIEAIAHRFEEGLASDEEYQQDEAKGTEAYLLSRTKANTGEEQWWAALCSGGKVRERSRLVESSVIQPLLSYWPSSRRPNQLWLPSLEPWLKRHASECEDWNVPAEPEESQYGYLDFFICRLYCHLQYQGSPAALMTAWVQLMAGGSFELIACGNPGTSESQGIQKATWQAAFSPITLAVYRAGCLQALREDPLWFLKVLSRLVRPNEATPRERVVNIFVATPRDVIWEALSYVDGALRSRPERSEDNGRKRLVGNQGLSMLRNVLIFLESPDAEVTLHRLLALLFSALSSFQALNSAYMATVHHQSVTLLFQHPAIVQFLRKDWRELRAELMARASPGSFLTSSLSSGLSAVALDNLERLLLESKVLPPDIYKGAIESQIRRDAAHLSRSEQVELPEQKRQSAPSDDPIEPQEQGGTKIIKRSASYLNELDDQRRKKIPLPQEEKKGTTSSQPNIGAWEPLSVGRGLGSRRFATAERQTRGRRESSEDMELLRRALKPSASSTSRKRGSRDSPREPLSSKSHRSRGPLQNPSSVLEMAGFSRTEANPNSKEATSSSSPSDLAAETIL